MKMLSVDMSVSPATPAPARGVSWPSRRRLVGASVAAAAAVILGVASFLQPSPTGLGTHGQLNMPACTWIAVMDVPCPTCGMTTAFAHAADGHLLASLQTQPLGFLLAITTAIALLTGVFVAATGSRAASMYTTLWTKAGVWTLILLAVGSWLYKIASYKELWPWL